jgi:ABC-type sugar transport system ATPase subunit
MTDKKEIALETIKLEKHFGGIKAVDGIDMKLYKNEILAIVGDNGAGKSTLIKTITGVHKKDGGKILVEGNEALIHNTKDARHLGIETVYQDKGLIQVLDAPSNLFLGRERYRKNLFGRLFNFLDFKYMRAETIELLARLSVDIRNITAHVSMLSGGQQQSVLVGRALYWSGKILIFDEPTNHLGVEEQHKAIELIRKIRDTYEGIAIIVITHNLYHVFELVDRIMVLRNGQVVGERDRDKTTRNEIISMITGLAA